MSQPSSSPDPADTDPTATEVPTGRAWLTALWCSFLAASLATVLFFALVDPAPVAALLQPTGTAPGRTALYSIGFLFFWTFSALAAGLTAWLLRPPPP